MASSPDAFNSSAIDKMFDSLTCQDTNMMRSNGMWFYDDPLNYANPLLMLQLSLVSLISRAMELLLKPMGQPMVIPQILGGMILGPSFLRQTSSVPVRVFPERSKTTLDTIASFGVMFFQFLVGTKMSTQTIIKSGKAAIVIGISVFVSPFIISLPITFAASYFISLEGYLLRLVTVLASSQSITIFPIVWILLAELKLLNSDIGHLATSSATIVDLCCWFNLAMFHTVTPQQSVFNSTTLYSFLSCLALVGLIFLVIRPAMIWIVKHTPDGGPVKEIYVMCVLVSVLIIAFISEVIGQHYVFGPFILGLAIPDGPPLGSALVEKLDHFVSGLLFPIYFVVVGLRTNIYKINSKTLEVVMMVVVINSFGKITAATFSSLYFKLPIRDALLMGIIMNANGITEIILYNSWRDVKILTDDAFSAVIVLVVLLTGSIAPLVRLFYDPSNKYATYKRRTIQHMKHDYEFRILVCIHNQENVPTMINLLEASNATAESPLCVYALYLVELIGRVTPLLISHKQQRVPSTSGSSSSRIFNAFHYYEQHNGGRVTVHPFTVISPFVSMHNDVCLMASDKRVSFIIMPFHKQWAVDGTVGSVNRAIRSMNRNVLDKAPCSVGIFIDRSILNGSTSVLSSLTSYNVAILFLGGADDREALAYGARMARHQSIRLTVVRFLTVNDNSSEREKKFNGEAINAFRLNSASNKRVTYKEEVVKDGEGTTNLIRAMENSYDLIIVGRYHRTDAALSGLTEWNDSPELGVLGDLLASPDFMATASVLVVQQQARVVGLGYQGSDEKEVGQGKARDRYAVHGVTDDDVFHGDNVVKV